MQPRKDHGGAEAARESKEPERGRIDYKCSGNALIEAIRYDDYEIVKYLIENRADVNLVVESGLYCSALQTAVGGYELYLVQMPIKFDLNRNQLDFLELLIENGANVNLPFKTGRCGSALAVAAFKGRWETVETLLNTGAIASLALNHGDYATALDAAIAGKEEAKKKKMISREYTEETERVETEQVEREYAEVRDLLQRAIQREERAGLSM